MTISKAQERATKKYLKNRKRFSIWYQKKEKDRISRELDKRGLKAGQVFEAGLEKFGIKRKGKN